MIDESIMKEIHDEIIAELKQQESLNNDIAQYMDMYLKALNVRIHGVLKELDRYTDKTNVANTFIIILNKSISYFCQMCDNLIDSVDIHNISEVVITLNEDINKLKTTENSNLINHLCHKVDKIKHELDEMKYQRNQLKVIYTHKLQKDIEDMINHIHKYVR